MKTLDLQDCNSSSSLNHCWIEGGICCATGERGNANDVYILQRYPSIPISFFSMNNHVNIVRIMEVSCCDHRVRAHYLSCNAHIHSIVCTACVYQQKHRRPGNINVLVPDKQQRISRKQNQKLSHKIVRLISTLQWQGIPVCHGEGSSSCST